MKPLNLILNFTAAAIQAQVGLSKSEFSAEETERLKQAALKCYYVFEAPENDKNASTSEEYDNPSNGRRACKTLLKRHKFNYIDNTKKR